MIFFLLSYIFDHMTADLSKKKINWNSLPQTEELSDSVESFRAAIT
jgi:hypothetical protein